MASWMVSSRLTSWSSRKQTCNGLLVKNVMAHLEIERKFLVVGDFKSQAYNVTHIEQGYFATEPGRTVRIRIRGDKGYLTIKGPSAADGISRYEFETEISLEDAHEMLKLCMPGKVVKDRYLVKCGKHTVEVDEFFGDNEGLVMAEIELGSEEEAFTGTSLA